MKEIGFILMIFTLVLALCTAPWIVVEISNEYGVKGVIGTLVMMFFVGLGFVQLGSDD